MGYIEWTHIWNGRIHQGEIHQTFSEGKPQQQCLVKREHSLRTVTSIILTPCFSPYRLFQKAYLPAGFLVFAVTAASLCGEPGGGTKIIQPMFAQQ